MAKKTKLLSELTDDELNFYLLKLRNHLKEVVAEFEKRQPLGENVKEQT